MAAVATRTQGLSSNPTSRTNSPVNHTKRSIAEDSKRAALEQRTDSVKASSKKTIKSPPNRAVTSQPKPSTNDISTTSNNTNSASTAPTMTASSAINNTASTTTTVPTITATTTSSTSAQPSTTENKSSLPIPPAPVVTEPSAPSDYFSVPHNKYGEEPNPFEQSFSVNDGLAPNKALLPPASSITSPAPNLASGFNWGINSLRSGPLSPAMLTGPSVFDPSLRTGLTPNESGIRSGLTPGGSGSMFPVPSPSTAALFGFGSGTTPGTMEFHKTALAAQAQNSRNKFETLQQPVPKVEEDDKANNMLHAPLQNVKLNPAAAKSGHMRHASDPFGGDADAAASGLYMLAQQGQQQQSDTFMGGTTSFTPANVLPGQPVHNDVSSNKRASIVSRGQTSTTSNGRSLSEASDGTDEGALEVQTNGRGTKAKATPKKPAGKGAGTRRKTEGDVGKQPAAKKAKKFDDKDMMDEDDDMDDMDDDDDDKVDINGKKMTEDEKRKNFLERNRVAALKCRQRKKQWLANLQAKVEYYGAENDALHSQVANLRDEVIQLKTLLLAHKDCPVNRSSAVQSLAGVDGIGALGQASEYQMNHAYGVAGSNMAPPGRRFS